MVINGQSSFEHVTFAGTVYIHTSSTPTFINCNLEGTTYVLTEEQLEEISNNPEVHITGTLLIELTIDGTSHQFIEGMTWEDWVDSEYNTDGAIYISDGLVYSSDGIIGYDDINIYSSDLLLSQDYQVLH